MNPAAQPSLSAQDCLVFTLAGRNHALPLAAVEEVLRMPLLQPSEGLAQDVLGLLHFRGRLVRVIDPAPVLGLPSHPPGLEDHVIVLLGRDLALRVDQLEDTRVLTPVPDEDHPPLGLRGYATEGTRVYHLLDLDAFPAEGSSPISAQELGVSATPEARERLEERAQACLESPSRAIKPLRSVLTFEWNGEGFALDLADIREILPCPTLTPVPGAPQTCLGLAFHRGEALLVLDLRPVIHLAQTPPRACAKLLVVDDGGSPLGLYVDDTWDVLALEADTLRPPLLGSGSNDGIEGEWVVGDRALTQLQLPALLTCTPLDTEA